jgi:4-amino-4-deoxy-L-arabinose transferase-like glycosyltransferase
MKYKFSVSKITILLFFAAFLLCLPMILFDGVARDAVSRYVPMADAFAASHWADAFHPRIPPLFVTISGIFQKIFFLSPEAACKTVSALFFALTVFPLMALFKLVFGDRYAVWGCSMYILCSRLIRIGGLGVRDTAKCFFLTLAAYGLLCFIRKLDWRSAVYCGLGCAGLALTRGDSLLFSLLFLLALCAGEIYKLKCFPIKTFCAGLLFLVLIAPWLAYEYRHTGWPVTEQRQAMILDRLFKRNPQPVPPITAPVTVSQKQAPAANKVIEEENDESFVKNLVKGFYPQYLIFILPVIFLRIYRKKMSAGEWVLLLIVFIHAFGMIAQIAIADKKLFIYKRYLIVATPLMFGWGAIGLRWLYDKIKRLVLFRYRWICRFALSIAIFILVMDGWSRVRKHRINPYLYEAAETYLGVDLKK